MDTHTFKEIPMIKRTKLLCAMALATLGLFHAGDASAQTKMYGLDTGIYCSKDGAGYKGLACDIMAEVSKRSGNTGGIEILPLARAAEVLAPATPFMVAPMAADGKNEKIYDFFAKFAEDEYVFVGAAGSAVDISTLEKAKEVRIGVLRGTSSEKIANAKGITKFEPTNQNSQNANKLLAGNIDAWLSTWNGARSAAKAAGEDPAKLRKGAVLASVSMYLAASPGTDKAIVAKWKDAFESMKKDGTLDKILKKYDWQ